MGDVGVTNYEGTKISKHVPIHSIKEHCVPAMPSNIQFSQDIS